MLNESAVDNATIMHELNIISISHPIDNTDNNSSELSNGTNRVINLSLYQLLGRSWVSPLMLYFQPTILLLGVIGNLFTIINIICRKLHLKSPIFVFFLFIATSDFIKITTANPIRLIVVLFDINIFYEYSLICTVLVYLTFAMQNISAWILVAAVAFKLYGMAYPFDVLKRNSVRIAVRLCVGITMLFLLMNLHVIFRYELVTKQIGKNVYLTYCYTYSHSEIISIIFVLIYSIIPGVLLLGISIAIIITFAIAYKEHKKLLQSTESRRIKQRKSTSFNVAKNNIIMLLPLSFFHILCTTPSTVYSTVFKYHATIPENFYVQALLILVNHSLNSFIQLTVSRYYREAMLPCFVKPKKPMRNDTTQTGYDESMTGDSRTDIRIDTRTDIRIDTRTDMRTETERNTL